MTVFEKLKISFDCYIMTPPPKDHLISGATVKKEECLNQIYRLFDMLQNKRISMIIWEVMIL